MTQRDLQETFYNIYTDTNRLVIYRNILKSSIVNKMRSLLLAGSGKDGDTAEPGSRLYEIACELILKAEEKGLEGNIWQSYLLYLIATDENVFSRTAEKLGPDFSSKSLYNAAIHDLKILKRFSELNLKDMGQFFGLNDIAFLDDFKPAVVPNYTANRHYWEEFRVLKKDFAGSDSPAKLADSLARFYHSAGCGKMGIYSAFRWLEEKGLVGIEHPDPVTLEDLIGYENQKEMVIKNTEAFIKGTAANNLLLYGERGTGKSSTIKALINKYSSRGLRLVEVARHQLRHFPEILRYLRDRSQRFIIFIDDLSFESYETEYKQLKALLEGGIEAWPDNVLIYATSNRRHLVQENWNDREGQSGEIHILDSVQEKLSLADRFGITITYTSPSQEEYLNIVEGLAEKHGLNIPREKLRKMALQWERWYNARSGRTAKQFINYLLGTKKSCSI